jgi:hypothetical protein
VHPSEPLGESSTLAFTSHGEKLIGARLWVGSRTFAEIMDDCTPLTATCDMDLAQADTVVMETS